VGKGRVEDGRVILPRPPVAERRAEGGASLQQQVDRAFEIQMESNRRLQANPVYRVLFIVGGIGGMILFDLWFLSEVSARWGIDAFTLMCVAAPWVGLALSTVAWLRRRVA
jgi:hypothetical protein